LKQIYEQISHKLSFIYKKIVRYAHTQLKNILERNKIDTQSRADACIRRKRLISKSDNNLKSGCTQKYYKKNPKRPKKPKKNPKNPKNQKKTKKPKKNPKKQKNR
jgi:hypothetical protein